MQGRAGQSSERDALVTGVVAALALCLGVAPDVGYGDAGELGTAAVVLGVAHPTGFALDLLWLKAASLIPLGSLAFRLNLATALAGGAAVGLCAAVIGVLAQRAGVRSTAARRLGVLLGVTGLLGFATFVAATRALEVYALALAAVLLALYLAIVGRRAAGLLALLVGLAFGMHVTAGLYAAPIFAAYLWSAPSRGRFLLSRMPALLAGMLVLVYLPLASRRDPAIDWGDPETMGGVLAHLSAQRIRNAFQGEMFGGNQSAPLLLAQQLSAFALLSVIALLAASLAVMRARRRDAAPSWPALWRVLVGIAAIAGLDLGYALLIHPMGVRELQCGHVAGACLAILGGVGAAWLLELAHQRRVARSSLQATIVALALLQLVPRVAAEPEDGYALDELFGSGGPIAALPPRSVFLCTSDNGCAASMFALAVERVRPDMDFAPAQHLWDATVLRQIEGFSAEPARAENERPARALQNLRALLEGRARRPLALETRNVAHEAEKGTALVPLASSPFLTPAAAVAADAFAPSLAELARTLRSRFGRAAMPQDARARFCWSRVYGELGTAALRSPALPDGVRALQLAAQIAPTRPTAWINLGVGLEAAGQLDAAVEVTKRAIELEPARATGWVNLARFEHGRGNAEGARNVLLAAEQAGVEDPRLQALAAQLQKPSAVKP